MVQFPTRIPDRFGDTPNIIDLFLTSNPRLQHMVLTVYLQHMIPAVYLQHLTFDLSLVSDWDRANLVLINVLKTQFLQLSNRHNLPDNYPLFFNNAQFSLSSTLTTLGLSFTKNLNWHFHIYILAKSASNKLGVLWRLRPLFSPSQLLALYKGLISPCMEYGSHIRKGSTHTALFNRVKSKAFRLIKSPPPTNCLDSLSHRRSVASL